jgi:hypothetical protein
MGWASLCSFAVLDDETERFESSRQILNQCYQSITPDKSREFQVQFATEGIVRLPKFLNDAVHQRLLAEVSSVVPILSYRNFVMPGWQTPRHMRTMGGRRIREFLPFLNSLYHEPSIIDFIRMVTCTDVFKCQNELEFAVINYQSGPAQTHGWHLDDAPYALIIILRAPESDSGNVELGPRLEQSEGSRYLGFTEKISEAAQAGNIKTFRPKGGDAYLLHASAIPHRVTECALENDDRLVITFAYCDSLEQTDGPSPELLYGDD